jgi:hypothetical protein
MKSLILASNTPTDVLDFLKLIAKEYDSPVLICDAVLVPLGKTLAAAI